MKLTEKEIEKIADKIAEKLAEKIDENRVLFYTAMAMEVTAYMLKTISAKMLSKFIVEEVKNEVTRHVQDMQGESVQKERSE